MAKPCQFTANSLPICCHAEKQLSPRQVADLLGHSTSEITEMYYVKKDTARLSGITEGFEL